MATITREELPNLIREELLHLLTDVPAIRYQLVGMMVETFAQRTDLQAILERIDAQREDFNRRMEEFAKRQGEHSRRMDEFSRRMGELREDFNRGFAQHSREIRDVDLHVQALGARWGILAEGAFREGIAGILTAETGLKVER